MICVHCHERTTREARCTACGEDPSLEGRYLLRAAMGAGAAATLYRATDRRTGADVAVKERHPSLDPEADRLFQREIDVLRTLDHPRIPAYVDAFTSGRGRARRHYLVQQLVDGRGLDAELAAVRFDEAGALEIIASIAEILVYLHGLAPPVVHRDIKPSNVMRRSDGVIVLVDFGAVRDQPLGTFGGATVAGTFGFMAPEQFMGDAVPASDVYALGALAVALLSRADPASLHDASRRFRWRSAVRVTGPTEALLDAMLRDDPAARPSAAGVIEAIRGRPPARVPPVEAPASDVRSRLDARAAEGAARRRAEQERAQAERAEAARQASRAKDEQAAKTLREALLPRGFGWVAGWQEPLTIAATLVTVAGMMTAFGLGGGAVHASILAVVGVAWIADLCMGASLFVGIPVAFLIGIFGFEAVHARACGALSRRELARFEAQPVPLELADYLDALSRIHGRAHATLTVSTVAPVDAPTIERVRDWMAAARLAGTAVQAGAHGVRLESPELDVVSYHGKRLERAIARNGLLHAWVRRALAEVVLPARDALGVASVTPGVRPR